MHNAISPNYIGERLVALGYALRRLGVLGLTEAGIRRLAAVNDQTHLSARVPQSLYVMSPIWQVSDLARCLT